MSRRSDSARALPADDGSVLVLALGLVVVCAAILLLGADLAVLRWQHRSAEMSADGAARAAAQALDLPGYYTGRGHGRRLPLDRVRARERAVAFLVRADGARWHLADLDLSDDRVTVAVAGTVRLPFAVWWDAGEVAVTGSAVAQLSRPAAG